MSEENVHIVREHIEAFISDAPSALAFLDHNVVLDRTRDDLIASETACGHEAVAQAVGRYTGAFDDYAYEVKRISDLGPGAVLVLGFETGLGRSSGVPVRRSFASLYNLIDGKITRITFFPDEQAAVGAI